MVYINFYFKELKMNDNIVKGVFDSPDNDVYCKFEYDINTRQFKIFDENVFNYAIRKNKYFY